MITREPPSGGRPPTGPLGLSMKSASLLTFQHSALILIMHYSRIMAPEGDHRYFASTAVFLNELLKLAISLSFALHDVSRALAPSTPATVIFQQIYNSVFRGDGWKLAIPAALNTLQNSLHYVAVSNLDAVHFQVIYQVEILATAIFTVTLLGRPIGMKRWVALIILTVGVAIVSLPQSGGPTLDDKLLFHDTSDHFFPRSVHELGQVVNGAGEVAHHLTKRAFSAAVGGLTKRSATYEGIQDDEGDIDPRMSYSIGLISVLAAATVSALNGVYFEKVLKDSPTPVSIWTRQIQLSFYSLFPALFGGVIFKDGAEIATHGFFDGYNSVVWMAITFHAMSGILTSLVINYADNIAKNFSTSFSILISVIFSLWFFDFTLTPTLLVGTSLVLFATYLYTTSPRHPRTLHRPVPIHVATLEKTTIDRIGTPRLGSATPANAALSSSAAHERGVSASPSRMTLDPMDAARGSGLGLGLSTSRPASPMFARPSARKDWDE
ncbi:related to UDP N-acetylglucosamine transporter (Golgi UDP-GlcNAc transporter) [Cephalotrichum gorgonifer]|uniref:Related to UDP N-acetylglucosamine transporter (Golgi UDP-GlcNAc transporter) n=1 Tax=Cephalotrichum gorgonifer TaxID=2041049 RepID=A0AAE8SXH8_9PEZI|nr:related to UDP N-acetylglucosamine transporter (Golgi UDP-GlcNAc transporter) [Cephalotrichum gorgonifer]